MTAYYNEIDPFAAQWLRNLIAAGHLPEGHVDERSIVDVRPSDLVGYAQCHFFAGIGGWPLALRLAGWPDDRPVWTGSCPCQPFSAAGKQGGFDDARHLWPFWFGLIRECRPRVVFGEQVASPLALSWLDLVQADMEGADYAFAAFDLCAAGVGAPHIRQRLGFVADAPGEQFARRQSRSSAQPQSTFGGHDSPGFVADAELSAEPRQRPVGGAASERTQDHDGLGIAGSHWIGEGRPGAPDSPWRDTDWLLCRDGKWRPVEARILQVVDGVPLRMGPLCPDLEAKTQEILNAAAEETTPDEVLRAVRDAVGSTSIFEWRGRPFLVHETQVLLAYLFEYAREEGNQPNTANGSGTLGPQRDVRMLWRKGTPCHPSHRRGLDKRCGREFADAVRLLSSAVARFAQEAGYPVLYTDAPASHPLSGQSGQSSHQRAHHLGNVRPSRVGMLRAYGNAIVPQVAAEFIGAYMTARAA